MNAERLHAIVDVLRGEIAETKYPKHLKGLVNGVRGASEDPDNTRWHKQIESELAALKAILGNSVTNDFSPIWKKEVREMEIADLLGSSLLAQIEDVLVGDGKTLEVATAEMVKIQKIVERLVGAVNGAASSLYFFRIGSEQLDPGEFELGFLIPRKEVNSGLKNLGDEFVQLQQIIGPLSELAGENRPEVEVRAISSSDFQVLLVAAPPIAASVAYALDRLASAYERITHIRLMKKELAEKEIPDDVLDPLADYTDGLVKAEIERVVEELIRKSNFVDEGRLNELRTDLQIQLTALTMRIEAGYNVEVRTGELPAPGEGTNELDPSAREAAESVLNAQEGIRSINAADKPIPRLEQPDGSDAQS